MHKITQQNVKRALDSDRAFALVEVLGREQYRNYHLPGAINVPARDNFETAIQQAVPDKTMPVIVYCLNTECQASPKAARRMEALGYQKVYDYEAGKQDWKAAGLPIEH